MIRIAVNKETLPKAPLEIDWRQQTDHPCHFRSPDCGIEKHLRPYHGKRRQAEAERLLALAKDDPDGFWRTCAEVYGRSKLSIGVHSRCGQF